MSIRVRSLDPQEWGLWRELRLRAFATRTGPFLEAEVDGEPAGMAPAGEMIGDPSSAGGGVRGPEDLRRLPDAGCDAALVATALQDGWLSAPSPGSG